VFGVADADASGVADVAAAVVDDGPDADPHATAMKRLPETMAATGNRSFMTTDPFEMAKGVHLHWTCPS